MLFLLTHTQLIQSQISAFRPSDAFLSPKTLLRSA